MSANASFSTASPRADVGPRLLCMAALLLALFAATPASAFNGATGPSRDPIDFLIITRDALAPAFEPFVQWKRDQGVAAEIRTLEWIDQNVPPGVDEQDRIRNFLRDVHDNQGLRTVMLGGDYSVVPVRLARSYFWYPQVPFIPTDWYYACLDGTWDDNGNGIYGEGAHGSNPSDGADFDPELSVGRLPADSPDQVREWVRKYLAYVQDPPRDGSLRRFDVLGEVLFSTQWELGDCDVCDDCPPGVPCAAVDGATDCFEVLDSLQTTEAGRWFEPGELYERDYWWIPRGHPNARPLNRDELLHDLNRGVAVVFHVGQGDRSRWDIGPDRLFPADLLQMPNVAARPRPAGLVYSVASETALPESLSVGKAWLFAPSGGSLLYYGLAAREFPGTGLRMRRHFFHLWPGMGGSPGEAFRENCAWAGQMAEDSELFRFLLYLQAFLGDPELRVYTADPDFSPAELGSQETAGFSSGVLPTSSSPSLRLLGPQPSLRGTNLTLHLPAADRVELRILDLAGRERRRLSLGDLAPGDHGLQWDGRDADGREVPSGAYLVQVRTGRSGSSTVRQVLIR